MIAALFSFLSGGAFGIIGKWGERWLDIKAKKLDMEIENQRMLNQLRIAELQGKMAVEVEDSKAFKASIESDGVDKFYEGKYTPMQRWLMVFLDFSRGFIRIGLTAYLCVLTTLIYFKAEKIMSLDILMAGMAFDLLSIIINTILFLTTMACSWQFGSRGSNAPVNKK